MELPFSPTRARATELNTSSIKRTLFHEEEDTENNRSFMNTKAKSSSSRQGRSSSRSPTPLSTITNTSTYTNNNHNNNVKNAKPPVMKFKVATHRSQSESPRRSPRHMMMNGNENVENITTVVHDTRGKARAASATRANIQQIRQQIKQSQNRSRDFDHKSSNQKHRMINIPMNKVTEMRQILFEENKRQNEKLKLQGYLSAKKRAEIKERLNKVEDIHKMLDEGTTKRSIGGNGKARTLDLPLNRVNDMKSWLVDFEKQNRKSGKSINDRGNTSARKHVPRIGGRSQPYELDREAHERVPRGSWSPNNASTTSFDVDDGALPQVSELKQWLVDFELKNKAHYEKGTKRPKGGLDIVRVPRNRRDSSGSALTSATSTTATKVKNRVVNMESSKMKNSYDDGQVQDISGLGDDSVRSNGTDENEDGAILVVENTSFLEKGDAEVNMNNISMMPGTSHNGGDTYDWEDDYEELTKVNIDIEPVVSADWDKDSATSPDSFSEADGGFFKPDESKSKSEIEGNGASRSEEEDASADSETARAKEATLENIVHDQEELATSHFSNAPGIDPDQQINESDYDDLTFADETISKLSFDDGGHMAVLTMKDFVPPTEKDESKDVADQSICSQSQAEELLGVDILSKSFYGPRFSNISNMQGADTKAKEEVKAAPPVDTPSKKPKAVKARKKKGLGRYFKALKKMLRVNKSKTTSKAATMYEQEMGDPQEHVPLPLNSFKAGNKKPLAPTAAVGAGTKQQSTKSLELSPDSQHKYLPNSYNTNPLTLHGMLSKGQGYNDVGGSPMSIASAYRRQMSPTSSSMSGFTDVEACVMKGSNNVGQHVGWLQDMFGAPVKAGEHEQGTGPSSISAMVKASASANEFSMC